MAEVRPVCAVSATEAVEVAWVMNPHPAATASPPMIIQSEGPSMTSAPHIQTAMVPMISVRRPKCAMARPSPSTTTEPTR